MRTARRYGDRGVSADVTVLLTRLFGKRSRAEQPREFRAAQLALFVVIAFRMGSSKFIGMDTKGVVFRSDPISGNRLQIAELDRHGIAHPHLCGLGELHGSLGLAVGVDNRGSCPRPASAYLAIARCISLFPKSPIMQRAQWSRIIDPGVVLACRGAPLHRGAASPPNHRVNRTRPRRTRG